MSIPFTRAVILSMLAAACATRPPASRAGMPSSTPERQGVSSAILTDAVESARERGLNIHSLTILRHDHIVLDAYFYPYRSSMRHDVASVTKSITALLTTMAIADGHLRGTEQPVVETLPGVLVADDRVRRIRVGDLLSMQSGLECGIRRGETELVAMRKSANWTAYALNLPVATEPGTRFAYCSPNFHLLSASITSRANESLLAYATHRLFEPLGITDVRWPADAQGITHGWGDLQLHPIDMAKIGLLMLHGGRWRGTALVPASSVDRLRQVNAHVNQDDDYGLGWWVSRNVSTLFEANGRGGQRITILPAKDAVIVMTGGGFEPGDIGAFLLRALASDAALPADPAGEARLQAALQRVSAPPAPRAVSRSPTASRVSGRRYVMTDNALSLASLSIEFSGASEAVLHVRLADGTALDQTLGLDGVYRLSRGQYDGTSAGRGEWLPDGRFRAELNTLTRVNRYIFDIEFLDDAIRIDAFEPTELGRAILTGIASSSR